MAEVWAKGGEGGIALAEKVLNTLENKKGNFKPIYTDEMPLKERSKTISSEIHGADGVSYALQLPGP